MKFKLKTSDAVYNAGLLGLVRIFDNCEIEYAFTDDGGMIVEDTAFESFTENYLHSAVDLLGSDMPFRKLEDSYVELKNMSPPLDEGMKKKLEEIKKFLVYKMNCNSYKAAYSIIGSRGEGYNYIEGLKRIKASADSETLLAEMSASLEKMKQYRDIFLLKDITYSQIQYFWNGVSFLNSQESTTDFISSYDKTFFSPFDSYVKSLDGSAKRKTTKSCCQCYAEISTPESFSMSWINNQGVDLARKTSPFWNFKPDLVICPLCALVYSCVPFGFRTKGNESYFINKNTSIKKLRGINNENYAEDGKSGYYKIIRQFLSTENRDAAENEINNIQVLKRSGDTIYRNILSKDKLSAVRNCSKEFERLVKADIKLGDAWHNLFDEVIARIFNHENLWWLMYAIIYDGIKSNNSYGMSFISDLHKIQNTVYGKGDATMSDKIIRSAFTSGHRLRAKMMGPERNENKVTALSFRLLNALKCKNDKMFLEALMRQYLSEGTTMPYDLCDMLADEESFLNFGYSFLSGLNSYTYNDGKNKEEKDND